MLQTVTQQCVIHILDELYGLQPIENDRISSLGSCQDFNYKVTLIDKTIVLKISNISSSFEAIQYQNDVLDHMFKQSAKFPGLSFPKIIPTKGGASFSSTTINGDSYFVRCLTFIDGDILSKFKYLSENTIESIGKVSFAVSKLLSNFPCDERSRAQSTQWNMKYAVANILEYLQKIKNSSLLFLDIAKIMRIVDRIGNNLALHAASLKVQVIHGDLAHYNLISTPAKSSPLSISGVIDFCDCCESWLLAELVIAITPLLDVDHAYATVDIACGVLKGFLSSDPNYLSESEVQCVWPMIILRSIMLYVFVSYELQLNPDNKYCLEEISVDEKILRNVLSVPISFGTEALLHYYRKLHQRELSGKVEVPRGVVELVDSHRVRFVDLSPTSDSFSEVHWVDDRWSLEALLSRDFLSKEEILVFDFGSCQLNRSECRSRRAMRCFPLGWTMSSQKEFSLIFPRETEVHDSVLAGEPVDAWNAESGSSALVLHLEHVNVIMRGSFLFTLHEPKPASGSKIIILRAREGEERAIIHLQVVKKTWEPDLLSSNHFPPFYSTSQDLLVWKNWLIDPKQVFTLKAASVDCSPTDALRVRLSSAASAQEYYFSSLSSPPVIERGMKQFLFDNDGRAYLDMVNNVAVVGHSREALAHAAVRQFQKLNTNSRFLYSSLSAFTAEIVSQLSHYDRSWRVFLVNSGSEATDLALRIARVVVTERRRVKDKNKTYSLSRDTICFSGGYHGVTTASDEVSSTLNDNPRSLQTRAPWIHLVPLPNMFSGPFKLSSYGRQNIRNSVTDEERLVSTRYSELVEHKISQLVEEGCPPSAFICEPLVGNAGGVRLPSGYLQRVYAAVRSVGGLCICDEVQVGYGRLGSKFWGFEDHGVIPDILTMAKAAGNGHPLGFVVTTEDIASEFHEAEGSFFSSAGGCPVSCIIGKEILYLIKREQLQLNALRVGEYLHDKLLKLLEKHPCLIGCIHGEGLYQGVELVENNGPAATDTTQAICDRLLRLGIICHGTGDFSNILKVKPPLCFTERDADYFVDTLDFVLETGWS